MRLGLVAEGASSVPAVHFLAEAGALDALGFGYADPAVQRGAGDFCAQRGIPFRAWSRGGLVDQVEAWVESGQLDLVITFGFPSRIPARLLRRPSLGFLNLHMGPLPAYRGPQPVFWQVRNGETQAGLALHRMDEGYDTGPVLLQAPVPLQAWATHGVLVQALGLAAPSLLHGLLTGLALGGPAFLDRAAPQGEGQWWPRPGIEDVTIRWSSMGAAQVANLARACNPWNAGAWTSLSGRPCRIAAAVPLDAQAEGQPGTVHRLEEGGLAVQCGDGRSVKLEVLRLEEGFFTAAQAAGLGLGPGSRFEDGPGLPKAMRPWSWRALP
jgi:methionyl-tRNA formyltransferase